MPKIVFSNVENIPSKALQTSYINLSNKKNINTIKYLPISTTSINTNDHPHRQLTVALGLPDGVTEAPKGGDDEEDRNEVGSGDPDEQEDKQTKVQNTADAHNGFPGDVFGNNSNADAADGVAHAQGDHVVADVLYAHRASDV